VVFYAWRGLLYSPYGSCEGLGDLFCRLDFSFDGRSGICKMGARMILYIAAPWKHRAHAREVAQQYRDKGHQVVSRWHDEWGVKSDTGMTVAEKREEAEKDVADVRACQAMVVLNWEKSEGKAVEQGIALERRTPIIVVGAESNVFHNLPSVKLVDSFAESLGALAELEEYL
jgi:hypothetical protein